MRKSAFLFWLFFCCFQLLPAYDLLLLSDTHYDAPDLRPELTGELPREIKRNFNAWQKRMPDYLAFYHRQAADGVDFVIHCGDIAQGGFSKIDDAMETRAVTAGIETFATGIPVRLYCIKGNHENYCVKPADSSNAVIGAYLRKLNLAPVGLNYTLHHRGDLFVFSDCTKPDLKFLRQALTSYPEAKRTFFITHFPVLPATDGNPSWIFCGKPKQEKELRELLDLLAARRAIVICGHIHRTTLVQAEFPKGIITQISIYSLPVSSAEKSKRQEYTGDRFFTEFLAAKKDAVLAPHLQAIFQPAYRRYLLCIPGCGLHRLKIGEQKVELLQYRAGGKLLQRITVAE